MSRSANSRLDHSALTADEFDSLLRSDFGLFVRSTFELVNQETVLSWSPYLDLICARLHAVAHGGVRQLIITLPPRHLKSFCVSVALPAYVLGHYPDQDIMCVSYGQELSTKFGEDTQKVMESPIYVRLFGKVLARARQPARLLRTAGGGVRRATSLEGSATGVGADLLIFDDPQKPGETLSEAMRRASNQAFENTFLSRRNNPATCRMIIVMQRLHEDDFVSHVLGLGGQWEVLNLPAIAEEDETFGYEDYGGPAEFRRAVGEALQPDRMPLETLLEIREQIGESAFATQYMQRPAPAGGGLVKAHWFRRYLPADKPAEFDRVVQSWDTANKVEEWNAYSVCTTWGQKGADIWLLDVFRQKLEYPDLKRAVVAQAFRFKPQVIYVEDRASGTQILQELRKEGIGSLREVKPSKDKLIRMTNQTAIIESGRVHIPEEAPWLADYLYELAVFPNGKFSDQVDSTSQALDAMHEIRPGDNLIEYYRREAEGLVKAQEEIWILNPPPSVSHASGRGGDRYCKDADGYFHVPAADAKDFLRNIGWSRVTPSD